MSVPARLDRALGSVQRWGERGVHLAPIRHHSPACALALRALLDEARPEVVAIEGPGEYAAVLPALQDAATRPPVAVLSLAQGRAFYPLAEFSPEWVALRWAGEHGAAVEFIDRSYVHDEESEDALVTVMAEHHLRRSAALAKLAADLGCRDHNEVWEHLFEDRPGQALADWRPFFADVLAWAALARLDARREDLDADGTHDREAVMASALSKHVAEGRSVVAVTGAFHTLALLEVLDAVPEGEWVTSRPVAAPALEEPSWLIRYDFTRLDALRGYGAGMPSPGFWQRAYRARLAGRRPREFTVDTVLDVVAALRADGEPLGAAHVGNAAEQTLRLADLRGRAWPGRADVLDGLLSTLAKDDAGLSGPLGAAVATVFATSELGELPEGVAAPPLIASVRARASQLRFDLSDAAPRRISLDTARKPRHRERREFCATMRFLGCGFARQIGGADLVSGTGLGQFVEEWEYAWTPMVETALIDASAVGPTVESLLAARITARLDAPDATVADGAALLVELVVMGQLGWIERACAVVRTRLADVPRLEDVVAALDALVSLSESSGRLSLGDHAPSVRALVEEGLAVVAYLLPGLAGLDRDSCGPAASALIGLRDLRRRLAG